VENIVANEVQGNDDQVSNVVNVVANEAVFDINFVAHEAILGHV